MVEKVLSKALLHLNILCEDRESVTSQTKTTKKKSRRQFAPLRDEMAVLPRRHVCVCRQDLSSTGTSYYCFFAVQIVKMLSLNFTAMELSSNV